MNKSVTINAPMYDNDIKSTKNYIANAFSNIKYEHLVAGISGGVVSTLVLHPLDLVKIRLAVNDGQVKARPEYTGLRNAVQKIFQQEGFKGFYRGVTPNCYGAGTAWGLFFLFYNAIKSNMLDDVSSSLHAGQHILAATEAGIMTQVLCNPIWVVKTRLCLQYGDQMNKMALDASKRYTGMFDALRKIYIFEGIRGLYSGFIPGIFGVSHGALQFMAYEELRRYHNRYYGLNKDDKLNNIANLSYAAISKIFAAVITYPYQVVRARLQDQHTTYNGVLDVIRKTWRNESVIGFYKGLVPNVIRVTPACAITFLVYENMIHLLLHGWNNRPDRLVNKITSND